MQIFRLICCGGSPFKDHIAAQVHRWAVLSVRSETATHTSICEWLNKQLRLTSGIRENSRATVSSRRRSTMCKSFVCRMRRLWCTGNTAGDVLCMHERYFNVTHSGEPLPREKLIFLIIYKLFAKKFLKKEFGLYNFFDPTWVIQTHKHHFSAIAYTQLIIY